MKESTSKTESRGRQLLIAVIVFLAVAAVVLITGVIFMQEEEITSLGDKIAELKPLRDDVTASDNKTRVSRSMAERGPARGQTNKGKHLGFSGSKQSQCQRIRIPLCHDMPYNSTQFPNLLNHRTQYNAIAVVEEFRAVLFQSKSSSLFRAFLCSVLAPPCHGYRKPTPPCQELCFKAVRSSRHLLTKHKITLPSAMRCWRLPKEGTSNCLNQVSVQRVLPCQDLRNHLCVNHLPPPHRVQFPNYFGHMNVNEAKVGFNNLDRIFYIAPAGEDCSFLLSHFLCRLHTPPCRKTPLPLPPCRELCLQAKWECQRFIDHRGFQWPTNYNCTQFPRKNEAPCYSGPLTGGETRMSQTGKCQVLAIPVCKNVPYNMTVFPNVFQHKTQNEASIEVHRWWPLVERKCSPDLAFFLCLLYAPLCTVLDRPLLPCRELCLRVQRECLPAIEYLYRSRWPANLQCQRFPRRSEEVCIDRPQNTPQVTVTPSAPARGQCEPLTISVCSGLHYKMTLVPNTFNHRTQQEAASEIHPLFLYSPSSASPWNDCSPELSLFVCSLHAPPCSVPRKPCRELCERVRNSCLHQLQQHGYPWPENMACDKFPNAGDEADCIGASQRYVPPTTIPPTTVPNPREDC